MKTQNLLLILALLSITILLNSCASKPPKTGFELQKEIWDYTDDEEEKGIYITSTKSIDSIDPNKLVYDFFRVEIDKYPDTVKLYARVYDSLGNFVTNMANPYKENPNINYFSSLKEYLGKVYNVKEVDVKNFNVREFGAKDSIPYNIVLTVDYSGSMSGVMDAIFTGTNLFVNLKMDYDKIGITTFNKEFDQKVPLTQDKQKILSLYNTRKERGIGMFSAVYDAVLKNIEMYEGTSDEVPRVLVIFSDGDDNYSKKEIGELMDKAKEKKIHIFSVAFGYSKDDNLRFMAKYTGGKFYKAYTKEELIAIFRDIYISLRYYYLISYHPPKFWGYHKVRSYLSIPGRTLDTLWAEADYNTSDLMPWDKVGTAFSRPINFDFDKFEIKEESFYILDEIADVMLSDPKLKLEIQGHTDNIGGIEYNLTLSENRAKSVFDAIVARGVEASRLRHRGFGFSRPISNNETPEGQAKNRRTEFVVLAK
jgi:outer membrane protein OmpA-like peptidoglycan-associated protein